MFGWEELIEECEKCRRCNLANNRTNVVIGRGNMDAPMMLIGEGPGEQEDEQGRPFVGPAGQLLDVLLQAQEIDVDQYYMCNIVKCRPPENRSPQKEEVELCIPFLRNQVALVKPRIIVSMGAVAMKYIIDKDSKITQIRGKWIKRKGYWIMPTFHPAALLRDPSKKAFMWGDFKNISKRLRELTGGCCDES